MIKLTLQSIFSIFTFQNVQTYSSQLVNVGVVYFGDEADFRSCHGILLGEKEFKFKHSPFKRRIRRSVDVDVKVAGVAFVRLCLDAWDMICNQTLSFLKGKIIHVKNNNILLV